MDKELLLKVKNRVEQEVLKLLNKEELSVQELTFLEHISGNYLYLPDIMEITNKNDETRKEADEMYKNAMERFSNYIDSLENDVDKYGYF